jgi:DNA-binding SARP family transcriptional activator
VAVLEAAASDRLGMVLDLANRITAAPDIVTDDQGRTASLLPRVSVRMLGGFEVSVEGCPVLEWRGRRGQAILQYLLMHRDRPVPRDVLVDAVWPDVDGHSGRRRLHQGVYALRQALGVVDPEQSLVQCGDGGYQLDPRARVWTDVEEFDTAADRVEAVDPVPDADQAISLCASAANAYGGDFLPDEDEADWVRAERERLRGRLLAVATRLARCHAARGDLAGVISATQRGLAVDGWNEECVELQMRAYLERGDTAHAIHTFQRYRDELDRELGVAPSSTICGLLAEVMASR